MLALLLLYSCQQEPPATTPQTHRQSVDFHPAADASPRAIDKVWSLVPDEFSGGIDAALNLRNGLGHWFMGSFMTSLDLNRMQSIQEGAQTPKAQWGQVPEAFLHQIDAAMYWEGNLIYLFSGKYCMLYDHESAYAHPPQEIAQVAHWDQLPPAFVTEVSAGVNDGLGSIFFFKNDQYLRYNQQQRRVVEGPMQISRRWPSLPPAFRQDLDAAMRIGRGKIALFQDGKVMEVHTLDVL